MMSSTALKTVQPPPGLYELDAEGAVLYCRIESAGGRGGDGPDYTGRNFYDEVAAFDNADELRRRVEGFLRSDGHADSFDFTCRAGDEATTVRVLLARIRERSNQGRTKAVLLHLRGAR